MGAVGEGRENGTGGLVGSRGRSLGVCLPCAAPDLAFAAERVGSSQVRACVIVTLGLAPDFLAGTLPAPGVASLGLGGMLLWLRADFPLQAGHCGSRQMRPVRAGAASPGVRWPPRCASGCNWSLGNLARPGL